MKLDILAFGAHPDDVELACSATLMKHIDSGLKAGIVDLTEGELGSRGTVESRYEEAAVASEIIGVQHRVNLKMADGFFEINEANKRLIVQQIRRFKPDIVFANAISDRHPDHGRAGQLVAEACFLSGLRQVNTEWNGQLQEAHRPDKVFHYIQDFYHKPDVVIDVTDYVDRKIECIQAYKTQFWDPDSKEPETPISGKHFFESVKARMTEYGRPIGARYAEGFLSQRLIGVKHITDLI